MSIGIHERSGRPCKEDNGYPLWWDDTLPVSIPDSPLPDRTDVAIIGGGFAGLSAAWNYDAPVLR
jgi:NADPH-dependent 2,4-dienoyl-CoA reductase/sulfur reductase-like enzyme